MTDLAHNWQARGHMTVLGEPRILHACDACGIVKEFTSPEFWGKCWGKPDHKPDGSGLDDGPYLPGKAPRKKPPAKSADELAATRGKAWETRRHLYGQRGHR